MVATQIFWEHKRRSCTWLTLRSNCCFAVDNCKCCSLNTQIVQIRVTIFFLIISCIRSEVLKYGSVPHVPPAPPPPPPFPHLFWRPSLILRLRGDKLQTLCGRLFSIWSGALMLQMVYTPGNLLFVIFFLHESEGKKIKDKTLALCRSWKRIQPLMGRSTVPDCRYNEEAPSLLPITRHEIISLFPCGKGCSKKR